MADNRTKSMEKMRDTVANFGRRCLSDDDVLRIIDHAIGLQQRVEALESTLKDYVDEFDTATTALPDYQPGDRKTKDDDGKST